MRQSLGPSQFSVRSFQGARSRRRVTCGDYRATLRHRTAAGSFRSGAEAERRDSCNRIIGSTDRNGRAAVGPTSGAFQTTGAMASG